MSGFLGSAFAADNFSDPLVDWVINLGITVPRATLDTIAVVLITLILSYFTLVFGELVPKRVAMKKAEALGLGISGLISGISIVFKPIVWFLSASTDAVLRLLGIDPNEADEQVSEEEIRMMVDTLVFTFFTSLSSAQSNWFKSMVRSEHSSSRSSVSSAMR